MEQSGEEVKWNWGRRNEATYYLQQVLNYEVIDKHVHDYVFSPLEVL